MAESGLLAILGAFVTAIALLLFWRLLHRHRVPPAVPREQPQRQDDLKSLIFTPRTQQRLDRLQREYVHRRTHHQWKQLLHQLGEELPRTENEFFKRLNALVRAAQRTTARLSRKERDAIQRLEQLVAARKGQPQSAEQARQIIAELRQIVPKRR